MKKRLIAFLLCFAMVMPILPVNAVTNELEVHQAGEKIAEVLLPQYETVQLTAEGVQASNASYQWQILVNDEIWVNISGADDAALNLTYAMVASLLDNGAATIRCKANDNGKELITDEVTVSIDYNEVPEFPKTETPAPVVLSEAQVVGEAVITPPAESVPAVQETQAPAETTSDEVVAAEAKLAEANAALEAAKAELSAAEDAAAAAAADAETAAAEADAAAEVAAVEGASEEVIAAAQTAAETAAAAKATADTAAAAVESAKVKVAEAETAVSDAEAALEAAKAIPTADPVASDGPGAFDNFPMARGLNGNDGIMTAAAGDVVPVAEDSEELLKYTVSINYVFQDNSIAAEPYTASLAKGSSFSATIKNPVIQGYDAYYNNAVSNSVAISVENISADMNYTVTYQPALVNYTVIHKQQNVNNDEYTEFATETLQGLTDSTVGEGNNPDVANTYDGFYALMYENPKIAADGSTLVEVKYDRRYYLMSFDLDGGYGVEPIYARYGAAIEGVGTPTKAGYTFKGWTLDGTNIVTLPGTMPAENRTYKAVWEAGESAKVTVVIWGENANDEGYSYIKSLEITARPGATYTYNGTNSGMQGNLWTRVKSDTVTVAADGSSVVNVYYDRTEFTLHFRRKNSNNDDFGTITDKWGANIEEEFDAVCESAGYQSWSENRNTNSPWTNYIAIMPTSNKTYYSYTGSGNNVWTMTYYTESLTDNEYTVAFTVDLYRANTTSVSEEEFLELNGFEFNSSLSSKVGSSTNGAKFYYDRLSYTLVFNNGFDAVRSENVKYEAPLSTFGNYVPDVPVAYAPGSVEFGGWYLNPECTGEEYKLSEHTMSASNLILYAKWVPVTHTVEFYLDAASLANGTTLTSHPAVTVPHGSKVDPTPDDPNNGNYKFIGWFYMDGNTEKAFDFENMPITKDMNVYGKWSSDAKMPYTVYYKIMGTDTEIADPTTGEGLVDLTKTFEAKGGNDLYLAYREGYFPVAQSHSMTININGGNEYTFEYVQKDAVPYTVYYVTESPKAGDELVTVEIDGKTYYMVAPTYTNSENRKAVVTENFVAVSGYMPDQPQKRLVVSGDEGAVNQIIFIYSVNNTQSYYNTTHYIQSVDGTAWAEYYSETEIGSIGATYTASPLEINGFTFDESIEGTKLTGELTEELLELKLYYTRNKYPYIVRYLEKDTGNVLADEKTGTPEYQGKTISETAIEIGGYTVDGNATQTLNIQIEPDSSKVQLNIITFYYVETSVTINYQVFGPEGCGTVNLNDTNEATVAGISASETVNAKNGTPVGATAAPAAAFKFVGWYTDPSCSEEYKIEDATENYVPTKGAAILWVDGTTFYAKFEYNLTTMKVTKTVNGTPYDADDTFIFQVKDSKGTVIANFTLKNGGSVTIADVTVGEKYTVEEKDTTNRYSAVSSTINVTIDADASKNVAAFTNNIDKTKWLTATESVKNVFGK